MDEIWERAVETALDGQTDVASVRTLTLDGAVKCVHGRLPPPAVFEKFQSLQHLSIANIGVSSLELFPRLRNLLRLILSDNRIAGGLKFLVEAGLESLRDLDLSNNRISDINDLSPLAELRLVSLDLYECPVTRVKDYRSRVFGLIKSLKYLDKTDAEGNERPETDDEDEDEEEDDGEEDDDPGSGEIDGGEDRPLRLNNGHRAGSEGVVDVDEDEESDADEEEAETSRGMNGLSSGGSSHHHSNGFRVEAVNAEDAEDDDDSVEEVYEDEGDDDDDEDEDVVEVHEIDDSDDDDGVDDEEEDGDDDEEEVDNDDGDLGEPASTRKFSSTEGEIDGHEQGEDDVDEDDNGETGEEDEEGVEEDGDFEDDEEAEDEEDDYGTGYLVQPVGQVEVDAGGGDLDPVNEGEEPELEEDVDEEDEDEDGEVQELPPTASHKRKRDGDDDNDGDGDGDGDDDDIVYHSKSSKHR